MYDHCQAVFAPLAAPDSFSIRLRIDQLAFSKGPENTAIPLDKNQKFSRMNCNLYCLN